jgi:hypothetical protein
VTNSLRAGQQGFGRKPRGGLSLGWRNGFAGDFPGPPPGSHAAGGRSNFAPRLLVAASRGKAGGGLRVYSPLGPPCRMNLRAEGASLLKGGTYRLSSNEAI